MLNQLNYRDTIDPRKDKDMCKETPIICCQVIRQLLRANAELQAYDEHDASPLHEAAAKGHVAAVQHLVSAKAGRCAGTLVLFEPYCKASTVWGMHEM